MTAQDIRNRLETMDAKQYETTTGPQTALPPDDYQWLRERVLILAETLESVEWSVWNGDSDPECCPVCGATKGELHSATCTLDRALRVDPPAPEEEPVIALIPVLVASGKWRLVRERRLFDASRNQDYWLSGGFADDATYATEREAIRAISLAFQVEPEKPSPQEDLTRLQIAAEKRVLVDTLERKWRETWVRNWGSAACEDWSTITCKQIEQWFVAILNDLSRTGLMVGRKHEPPWFASSLMVTPLNGPAHWDVEFACHLPSSEEWFVCFGRYSFVATDGRAAAIAMRPAQMKEDVKKGIVPAEDHLVDLAAARRRLVETLVVEWKTTWPHRLGPEFENWVTISRETVRTWFVSILNQMEENGVIVACSQKPAWTALSVTDKTPGIWEVQFLCHLPGNACWQHCIGSYSFFASTPLISFFPDNCVSTEEKNVALSDARRHLIDVLTVEWKTTWARGWGTSDGNGVIPSRDAIQSWFADTLNQLATNGIIENRQHEPAWKDLKVRREVSGFWVVQFLCRLPGIEQWQDCLGHYSAFSADGSYPVITFSVDDTV